MSKKKVSLLDYGISKLNDFQLGIYNEAILKGSGGLTVDMGGGKSLVSLVLNLYYCKESGQTGLFVCSKSLISNILTEIDKHFESGGFIYPHVILHDSHTDIAKWHPHKDVKLIIVTHSYLARCYDRNALMNRFILKQFVAGAGLERIFVPPNVPLLNVKRGLEVIYSRTWSNIIVDEIHTCCNITAKNCQAICCVLAEHRWCLTGTPLENPKKEQILGYLLSIGYEDSPHSLSETLKYIKSNDFPGLIALSVYREKNEAIEEINVKKIIVEHPVLENEARIFRMFRDFVKNVNDQIKELKDRREEEGVMGDDIKTLSSVLLATITYLRQSLTLPIMPLTRVALKMADSKERNEITLMLKDEIAKLGLDKWLDNEDAIYSSRINAVMNKLNEHQEQVVIFCEYRTTINVLRYYIKNNTKRKFYTLESNMSIEKRRETISKFSKSKRGVLVITYDIASVGINLQSSRIVFFADIPWSSASMDQALKRVARMGQNAKEVLAYYFICGAGVENAVFTKQLDKKEVLKKLMKGKVKRLCRSVAFEEFVDALINTEDTIKLVDRLYVSPEKYEDMASEDDESDAENDPVSDNDENDNISDQDESDDE